MSQVASVIARRFSRSTTTTMAAAVASPSSSLVKHSTVQSIRSWRKSVDPSIKIGFVPTMGALHEGHLSLVREARERNDIVVASVFVNPTQFGPNEDLTLYPRQLELDFEVLAKLGVDHLFAPEVESMYGKNHTTYVVPEGFEETAEGKSRPGHFRGVATIVTKLFHIVEPTIAYFGQKDATQCVLIKRLVEDLDFDIEIVIRDTVREKDGLAMSSRNAYLSQQERQAATVIYQSLCNARSHFQKVVETDGDLLSAETLRHVVESALRGEELVSEIEYVAIDDKDTMRPIETVVPSQGAIVSLAVKVGHVRLIDNIVL